MKKIEDMNKQEFLEFARNFNIFKTVQWPEYLNTKQQILNILPKHNLSVKDLQPIRNIIIPGTGKIGRE